MEELKSAFYEVMYKYQKSFGEEGVMANLTAWEKGKEALLTLLRHHPNWNEAAKAVVIAFKEGRGIERDVIDEIAFTLLGMAYEVIAESEKVAFTTAFQTAVGEYSNTLSEEALEIIRTHGSIKCATGQKTSRIIGKLCRQFKVDTHERYNTVFAQLSDALNPLQIEKTAVLSLHPCDFLEMSNKDNSWTSCHNLVDGSYQAGALSYMLDDVSMIFFTVDADVTENFYRAPRRTRQMFFFKENSLFQSRLYPDDSSDIMEQNRRLVQKALSACLGMPNLWVLKTKADKVSKFCESAEGSEQYPDYNYHGNVSTLKGMESPVKMIIGKHPVCVCCGDNTRRIYGKLKCDCAEMVVCQDCGKTLPKKQTRYIDNAFHCNACLHICSACGKVIRDTMYPAFDRRGNAIEVCFDCFNAALEPCAACSVQGVCRIIGSTFCQRAAIRQGA